MTDAPASYRFYDDLAAWWPLISPPEEYTEEAAYTGSLLATAAVSVREVLELGSGGGHNAVHLKADLELTLVDLSDRDARRVPGAQPRVHPLPGRPIPAPTDEFRRRRPSTQVRVPNPRRATR